MLLAYAPHVLFPLQSTHVQFICSKRRFANHQAEEWWKANKERVFKKYSYRGDVAATGSTMGTAAAEEDNVAASSQN